MHKDIVKKKNGYKKQNEKKNEIPFASRKNFLAKVGDFLVQPID